MPKEEQEKLIQFLKENLSISFNVDRCAGTLDLEISLCGETISKDFAYCSEITDK